MSADFEDVSESPSGWESFFRPDTKVMCLPGWNRPRLFLTAGSRPERWRGAASYPASGWKGRSKRFAQRLKASARVGKTRTPATETWHLEDFAGDEVTGLDSAIVMVGVPGSTQKLTAILRDREGRTLAYLKYAESERASMRVEREWNVLRELPEGAGPSPLKYGRMGSGVALLLSPVPGSHPRVGAQPPRSLEGYLRRLHSEQEFRVEDHPWLRKMRDLPGFPNDALDALSGRRWPVAVQHGDLAPWNMLASTKGSLTAIDWEYGELESFPLLDYVTYVLQVSSLAYGHSPEKANRYAKRCLSEHLTTSLDKAETSALVRITAYDGYQKSLENGDPSRWYEELIEVSGAR